MTHRKIISILVWLHSTSLFADSTFVGNGGNTGDIDISMTREVIRETLQRLKPEDVVSYCRCGESTAKNQFCTLLNSLSDEQAKSCHQIILDYRHEMARLAERNSPMIFTWSTDDSIVAQSDHSNRPSTAVTNPSTHSVVIAQSTFRGLPESHRIALITHELLHATKINGKHWADEEQYGGFSEVRGLFDAVGAAVVVSANEEGVMSDFRSLSRVSKSYKKFYFDLGGRTITHSSNAKKHLFKRKNSSASFGSFTYKFGDFGVQGLSDYISYESEIGAGIKLKETAYLYGAGLSYYFMPIDTYASRWSELMIRVSVNGLQGQSQISVEDQLVSLEDKSAISGYEASIGAYIPLIHGFWFAPTYGLRHIKTNYKDFDAHAQDLQHLLSIGVTYGF